MWGGIISRGLWKNSRIYARGIFEHAGQSTIAELDKFWKAKLNELKLNWGYNQLGRVL
jgi:hypothetical protein